MIEQTLEGKIITQISASLETYTCNVIGFWQSASDGEVKEAKPPYIRVSASPSANDSENIPEYTCSVQIEIISKIESDPQKVKLAYWCGQVIDLFRALNGNTSARVDYSETDVYKVHGVAIQGGSIGWDSDDQLWYATIPVDFHFCKL